MGRAPCCDKANVKKGPWSPEEDAKLKDYIDKYGTGGNWIALPHKAGLRRCGKSCRLRWLNYLRPNIKHGDFTDDEDRIICSLFASIGSRWSIIAAQLPGRTDNDIKNYWNTKLKKKLLGITSSSSSQKRILQSTVPAYLSSASLTPSAAHNWPDVIGGGGNHEAGNYYYTTQGQLIDSLSLISSHLFNTTTATSPSSSLNTAAHEGYNHSTSTTSSMQNYQVQDMSFLRFGNGGGGDQASSSSSDGSSTYDYGASIFVNINNNNNNLNMNMNMNYFSSNCVADNPLDDSLEEIKQLISTTNLCNNFFVHEIKTEEKVTYY